MKTRARAGKAIFWLAALWLASLPVLRAEEIMRLSSPGFDAAGHIPPKYTCDGKNASPSLEWSGQPANTQSFIVMAEDSKGAARWIVAKIPPTVVNLPEGLPAINVLANSEVHGKNDLGKTGYDGPCSEDPEPEIYTFSVLALDEYLPLEAGSTREEILSQIEGHVIARGLLKGKYRREKNSQAA